MRIDPIKDPARTVTESNVDGPGFRQCLKALGMTQVEFAETYDVSRRAVQYWFKDGPPKLVALLLAEMVPDAASELAPADLTKRRRLARELLRQKLGKLPARLAEKGWSTDDIAHALSELAVETRK